MEEVKSEVKKLRDGNIRLKRFGVALGLIIIIVALIFVAHITEIKGYKVLAQYINALAATVVSVLVVSFFYQWIIEGVLSKKTVQYVKDAFDAELENKTIDYIKKAYDKDLESKAVSSVTTALTGMPDNKHIPLIYELYNKTALEKLLRSFLEVFCINKELADTHLKFIKDNRSLIKKDEIYNVKVGKDERTGKRYISQSLTDTHIRKTEAEEKIHPQNFSAV